MSDIISKKLRKLAPYQPDITQGAVHLDANESFLELSDQLKTKIAEKIREISYNRYPDPLAAGACGAFARRYGVPAELVTAGNGSDELISLIMGTFVDKGGKVLMTRPDFSMYRFYCSISECEPVVLGKAGDLNFDPDKLIALALKEKVSLVIFSNPCNPTGQGLMRNQIINLVKSLDCLVVVDEAYMDFWDQSVLDCVKTLNNLIVLKTCSKIGFAAARMGFAAAGAELTGYLRSAKSPYNLNALTQSAAECFLNEKEYLDGAVETIKSARDSLYHALRAAESEFPSKISIFPTYANFVLAEPQDAPQMHNALRQSGVSVRLVDSRYLRITAGSPRENELLVEAVINYLRQEKK